jgi:hypothetical protein
MSHHSSSQQRVVRMPECDGITDKDTRNSHESAITQEPIVEEDPKPNLPSIINGICVNTRPRSKEIKEVIDFRRIRPHRQTFYLAKTVDGDYYWFHTPYAARGRRLRKLIGDYRRKLRTEARGGKRRTSKRGLGKESPKPSGKEKIVGICNENCISC